MLVSPILLFLFTSVLNAVVGLQTTCSRYNHARLTSECITRRVIKTHEKRSIFL